MGRVLAVDFDGVIHDRANSVEGRKMGPPIDGAKETLKALYRNGDTIIVFCVWGGGQGEKVIADWMQFYGIPFDKITNVKPQADCYLDDKAVRFTDWPAFAEFWRNS